MFLLVEQELGNIATSATIKLQGTSRMSSAIQRPALRNSVKTSERPSDTSRKFELRALLLCADDFALSEGVSEGIIRLAEAGRLSAISCMSASPLWPSLAPHLRAIARTCDVGLHLTLTDQTPAGSLPHLAPGGQLPSHRRLLALAASGQLGANGLAEDILEEIDRQWRAFVDVWGRPPDFIDGHQHVHLLAGVRNVVCSRLASLPVHERPYLRLCWDPFTEILRRQVAAGKALLLAAMSRPLRRETARLGITTNDSFRGVHGFDATKPFAPLMRRFLGGAGQRPLVMCHPGFVDARLRALDPVTDQRRVEYDYLSSDGFLEDLAKAGLRLARFRNLQLQTRQEKRFAS